MPPRVAVIGSTASGKSSVAMAVAAERDDTDIISVDSMQVYRHMSIGTAKPTVEEQQSVRHHLIDIVDPSEEFTVAIFQHHLEQALSSIAMSSRCGLLVGGTGLYHRAAIDGLDLAGSWPEIRQRLEAEAEADAEGTPSLHHRLVELDPVAASRMEPTNTRRVVRALEVIEGSGELFSSFGSGLDEYPDSEVHQVGLRWPREVLATRIEQRVHRMMDDGFLHEVEHVLTLEPSRTARQALGYRELIDHLEGRCSLDEAIDATVTRTRQFAVKQERWFRRDPRIEWIDIENDPVVEVAPAIRKYLP
ncbi:MAG: tRNA (adenosine(37)-N6)-dimethylallyltransferase MiaA [Acidimicrobiaceae bacterium]